ncbi:APC family permease [Streptomyces sp. NBC_01314]|uniref:APC family permease n=1 Tax=Streptomyces sp. NBC_01314 TaxID=2903821 RepID=UPI00352FC626
MGWGRGVGAGLSVRDLRNLRGPSGRCHDAGTRRKPRSRIDTFASHPFKEHSHARIRPQPRAGSTQAGSWPARRLRARDRSVIGTGVFALPSALAPYGPVSLVAFIAVTLGALALALTFGALSKRVPADGRPYVHAREAFGEFTGFLNAWSHWITAWAGNAAVVVAWVGYVEVFVNTGHRTRVSMSIALIGLWIPAPINLSGVRNIGAGGHGRAEVRPAGLHGHPRAVLHRPGQLRRLQRQWPVGARRDLRGGRHRPVQSPRPGGRL